MVKHLIISTILMDLPLFFKKKGKLLNILEKICMVMVKKLYLIIGAALIVVVIIAAAFLSTQNSNNPPAAKSVSGLSTGDTFTYSLKGYADIIDDNGTVPASFSELNKTDIYQVTITNVNGGQISYNTTWRFVNGTDRNMQSSGNILTGISDANFWAIYPSNLTLYSLLRPSGTDGMIVNETETRTYNYGPRTTNVMSVQNYFVNTDDPTLSRSYTDYLYVHFDKITGMLVELKEIKVYSGPQIILTVDWQLQYTNVWSV
jgi:hypothetical protein